MRKVNQSTIDGLKNIFQKIHDLLEREQESNWIRGIESILLILKKSEIGELDIDTVFSEVRTSYRSMNSGHGSFSDLVIWRDDFDDRKIINDEFEVLADKAWKLLDL